MQRPIKVVIITIIKKYNAQHDIEHDEAQNDFPKEYTLFGR